MTIHGYVRTAATGAELGERCRAVRDAVERDTMLALSAVYIGSAGYADLILAVSRGDVVYASLAPGTGGDQLAAIIARGADVREVDHTRRNCHTPARKGA